MLDGYWGDAANEVASFVAHSYVGRVKKRVIPCHFWAWKSPGS